MDNIKQVSPTEFRKNQREWLERSTKELIQIGHRSVKYPIYIGTSETYIEAMAKNWKIPSRIVRVSPKPKSRSLPFALGFTFGALSVIWLALGTA